MDQSKQFAIQSFAKQLLDVADNLSRALESVPAEALEKKVSLEVLVWLLCLRPFILIYIGMHRFLHCIVCTINHPPQIPPNAPTCIPMYLTRRRTTSW